MDMKKKDLLLVVSASMLVLFTVLAFTGLINWWVLPRGSETSVGFFISLRHFLRDIHEWAALFFMIFAGAHLWLHKDYIVNNWNKYFGKKPSAE